MGIELPTLRITTKPPLIRSNVLEEAMITLHLLNQDLERQTTRSDVKELMSE